MGRGKGRDRKKKHQEKLAAERAAKPPWQRTFKDHMGIYHDYLNRNLTPPQIDEERKRHLRRIGEYRKSAVMSYAARIAQLPQQVDISVNYEDLLPFSDILGDLSGDRVTVILETPGGLGEVGKDMVELLHEHFAHVEFLVPGMAKSTGTIMCLGGHEILMGPGSSLGPIDAQIFQDGKRFSADAFLEGFDAIKAEVATTGQLNAAYIPMLQRISPGELRNAHNALEFAREIVTDWLVRYKFANWEKDGKKVDETTKQERAREIADSLSRQSRWFSHSRSLRIKDLEGLKLKITDFSQDAELNDAVLRYQVLLQMTFEMGPIYKIVESPLAIISRRFQLPALNPDQAAQLMGQMKQATTVVVGMNCPKCAEPNEFQVDFAPGQPLQPGARQMPNSSKVPCKKCGNSLDLLVALKQVEAQLGKKALSPQPQR